MRRHKGRLSTFHWADKRKKSQLRLITTKVMKETEGDRKERKSLLFLTWEKVDRSTISPPKFNPVEGDGGEGEGEVDLMDVEVISGRSSSLSCRHRMKKLSVSQSNESKVPSELFCLVFPSEKSHCHMFIQAAPQWFNLVRILLTLRCLRQIKAENGGEGSGSRSSQVFLSESWRPGSLPRIWCLYVLAWCCVLWLIKVYVCVPSAFFMFKLRRTLKPQNQNSHWFLFFFLNGLWAAAKNLKSIFIQLRHRNQ